MNNGNAVSFNFVNLFVFLGTCFRSGKMTFNSFLHSEGLQWLRNVLACISLVFNEAVFPSSSTLNNTKFNILGFN